MRRSGRPDSARGRPFPKGNPGRKPGSKNRTTLLAAALLAGESEALLRTATHLALADNVPMLKFLLRRTMPRDRLVKLDLPEMVFADDGSRRSDALCAPSRRAQ
jgi:hypothetical protein